MPRNRPPPARICASSTSPRAAAEAKIDVTDDAGADFRVAVAAGRAHRGDAVDELGFADRAEFLGPAGAMHRAALHEHGADDVMAAVGVRQQIIEHVAPAWPFPQMMVRIDDRQRRLQDRFGPPREPVVADRQIGAGLARGGAHGAISSRAGMLARLSERQPVDAVERGDLIQPLLARHRIEPAVSAVFDAGGLLQDRPSVRPSSSCWPGHR